MVNAKRKKRVIAASANSLPALSGTVDRSGIVECLEGLAEVAVLGRAFESAVFMLAAASAWREINDLPIASFDRAANWASLDINGLLLTPREQQVAELVSRGLTNRGIAEELRIAPATAALHVEHVRGKLGFHTRSQIAAWVARGMSPPF